MSTSILSRARFALRPSCAVRAALIVALGHLAAPAIRAQATATLTLTDARTAARQVSPDLMAAREAVAAARGRERQAGAYQNPTFGVSREQSSGGGQSNSQNIALLEQPIELGGLRSARRDAASARREAAEARLVLAEAQLDYDVTRAYALAIAAERRAALADQATAAFTEALRVSERRLAAGDVSGYTNRRLKLEAARYGTLRAEAVLARRSARIALASLVTTTSDSIGGVGPILADSVPTSATSASAESLLPVALRSRAELRAAVAEARAAEADARLAASERMPIPVVSGGIKSERVGATGGGSQGLTGLVAGLALPLPLWDRRAGSIEAADAEARRRVAELDGQRRRVAREVAEAYDASRAADAQIAMLAPQLGAESRAALRAAQVAYAEGEITLVEWLDAVRAYREAEASFAALQAESTIRRAALERAVGAPLVPTTSLRPTLPGVQPAAPSGLDR